MIKSGREVKAKQQPEPLPTVSSRSEIACKKKDVVYGKMRSISCARSFSGGERNPVVPDPGHNSNPGMFCGRLDGL